MSADADRGAVTPKYLRAEIRSCERRTFRNDEGIETPYVTMRGFNMLNEPVRIIMMGKAGDTHEEGDIAEVLRQFPSSPGGEGMEVRRVARAMGAMQKGKTDHWVAHEIVRLNGPGADLVLARRDGVMALDMASRLHAAGDVDAAFRLLEDRIAQMCAVPAPSVVRESELVGTHPGPDPEGIEDAGVAAPGEGPEDRARRIYRSVDQARGRAPASSAPARSQDAAGTKAPDAVPEMEPRDGTVAETTVSQGDVEAALAVPPVAMPVHEEAAPAAAPEPDVPDASVEAGNVGASDGTHAPVAEVFEQDAPEVSPASEAPTDVVMAEPADAPMPQAEAEPVTVVQEPAEAPAPVDKADEPSVVDATPVSEAVTPADLETVVVAPETLPGAEKPVEAVRAAVAPAMPGFRSRARMGVPSVATAAKPVAAAPSSGAANPAAVTPSPSAKPAAKPQPEPVRPAAAPTASAGATRPPGRPRMGMGRVLPPAAQPTAEPEDEPVGAAPRM